MESGPAEAFPRALERAVTNLVRSQNRYSRRSFNLLKVLTVLADGETLPKLKYFDQVDPFFATNASELEDLQLIQMIPLAEVYPSLTQEDSARLTNPSE